MDIPFGVSFRIPNPHPSFVGGYSFINLGLYYAMAMDAKVKSGTLVTPTGNITGDFDNESYLGLLFDSLLMFPIAESGTSLGIKISMKYGFDNTMGPALASASTKAFDFGFGLAFMY